MKDTLVLWTHNSFVPFAGAYVEQANTPRRFRNCLENLKHPKAREQYNRIIVSSFNEMQLSFGLNTTGKLVQSLSELERDYDYTVIVLPHSAEISKYLED